jgi:hypothetical protein
MPLLLPDAMMASMPGQPLLYFWNGLYDYSIMVVNSVLNGVPYINDRIYADFFEHIADFYADFFEHIFEHRGYRDSKQVGKKEEKRLLWGEAP